MRTAEPTIADRLTWQGYPKCSHVQFIDTTRFCTYDKMPQLCLLESANGACSIYSEELEKCLMTS